MHASPAPQVDVVVLHRPGRLPQAEVLLALRSQHGIQARIHLHEGAAAAGDQNRWATIARARNLAKRLGTGAWFMFVDDDVVLAKDCIAVLLSELQADRRLAAVAADYDGDGLDPGRAGHVGMGATLFRRSVLDGLMFRWTVQSCECWCACWDLRNRGYAIRYSPAARATHLKPAPSAVEGTQSTATAGQARDQGSLALGDPAQGCILAAFDRRDISRFEHQFLRSLRASGNREWVIAVVYGLYPSEQARLRGLQRVHLVPYPFNGVMPPVRRLGDFAAVTQRLPPATPVAYWDVADVVFQDSLADLWQLVRQRPDRLLAVKEPKGYPDNEVIFAWTMSIRDPNGRQYAWELLRHNSFLNSGFAAGTAATLTNYFQRASLMRNEPLLAGTTDWGDQMALNMYCHCDATRWWAVDERWNYCVHDRPAGEVWVTPAGRVISRSGQPIAAAHGNARSLRQFALSTAIH